MLVVEVLDLANWVDRNFKANQLAATYTNLINKLNANAANNRQAQPFDVERKNLDTAVGALDLKSLSEAQVNLLKEVGVYDSIGSHGVGVLHDIFVENAIDIQTAKNRVQQLKTSIDTATTWANDTRKALGDLFDDESAFNTLEPYEVVIRVRFTEEAGIYNVVDLKKWSAVWFDILRGFALAIDSKPVSYTHLTLPTILLV